MMRSMTATLILCFVGFLFVFHVENMRIFAIHKLDFPFMNFLAHAHLSGDNKDVLLGNFIADGVKGRQVEAYSVGIVKGIQLHRMIDQYTDQHPIVKESVQLVKEDMGRYSAVVVDIFYDHFLAANWSVYSDQDLVGFSMHVYRVMARNFFQLPTRFKRMLPFMVGQNWLASYASLPDLNRVFYGMNRRTGYRSAMEEAVPVLQKHYDALQQDFLSFYPLLQGYTAQKLAEITQDAHVDRSVTDQVQQRPV